MHHRCPDVGSFTLLDINSPGDKARWALEMIKAMRALLNHVNNRTACKQWLMTAAEFGNPKERCAYIAVLRKHLEIQM